MWQESKVEQDEGRRRKESLKIFGSMAAFGVFMALVVALQGGDDGMDIFWGGLLAAALLVLGVSGLLGTLFIDVPRSSGARPDGRPRRALASLPSGSGPGESKPSHGQVLSAARSHGEALFFISGFALLWIYHCISMFIEMMPELRGADASWLNAMALLPFLLVGLALIVVVIYLALLLLYPPFIAELSEARLVLGSTCLLRWRYRGWGVPLRQLTLSFEGRESATYRQGTSTETDHHTFFSRRLLSTREGTRMKEGSLDLRIPDSALPSFESTHNKIEWLLVVHGKLPVLPDLKQEMTVMVHPAH